MISAQILQYLLQILQIELHGSLICIGGGVAFGFRMGSYEESPDLDANLVQLGGSCACAHARLPGCWARAHAAIEKVHEALQTAASAEEFTQKFAAFDTVSMVELELDPEFRGARVRRGRLFAGGRAWLGHLSGGFMDKFVLIVKMGATTQRLLEVCTASSEHACAFRRGVADLAWSDAHMHWYESDARQSASLQAALRHRSRMLINAIREWCQVSPDASGARYRVALLKPKIDGLLAKVGRTSRRLRCFGEAAQCAADEIDAAVADALAEYGSERRASSQVAVAAAEAERARRLALEREARALSLSARQVGLALALRLAETARAEHEHEHEHESEHDCARRVSASRTRALEELERSRRIQLALAYSYTRISTVEEAEQERARRMGEFPRAHMGHVRAQMRPDECSHRPVHDRHPTRACAPIAEEEAERSRRISISSTVSPLTTATPLTATPSTATPLTATATALLSSLLTSKQLVAARLQINYNGLLQRISNHLRVSEGRTTELIFGKTQVVQIQNGESINFCTVEELPSMRESAPFLISIVDRLEEMAVVIDMMAPSDMRQRYLRFYMFVGNWMCWIADEQLANARHEYDIVGRQVARGTEPRTRELFKNLCEQSRLAAVTRPWVEQAATLTQRLRPDIVRSLTPSVVARWLHQQPWQHLARTALEYIHKAKCAMHSEGNSLLAALESMRQAHIKMAQTLSWGENYAKYKTHLKALDGIFKRVADLMPVSAAGWLRPPPKPLRTGELVAKWTDRCAASFFAEQFDEQTFARDGELLVFHLADSAIGDIAECISSVRAVKKEEQFKRWLDKPSPMPLLLK